MDQTSESIESTEVTLPAAETIAATIDAGGDEVTAGPPPAELAEPLPEPSVDRPVPLRLLRTDLTEAEAFWKRRLFELIALAIAVGFGYFILSYWAPATPAIDENAYLAGGKQLAKTGSPGVHPGDPFQFFGAMWNISGNMETGEVWYYPKYPLGIPLLNAIPIWVSAEHGKDWALYNSPIATSLALLAMFLIGRLIAGSFAGICAMLLLGMNYVTLILADMPWSHGPALFFVTWGMYLALRFWQTASLWRGVLAGLLLGFAVTIRYTEGLLLLPLLLVTLSMLPYRAVGRVSWWRIVACLAIAVLGIWLRLKLDNRHSYSLSAAAALLTLPVVCPVWRFRELHRLRWFWLGVAAALLVATAVVLPLPAVDWYGTGPKAFNFGSFTAAAKSLDASALIASLAALAFQPAVLFGAFLAILLGFIYSPPSWRRAALPVIVWLAPVIYLLGFNWFAMGTITGYDSTNESTAFTGERLVENLGYLIQEFHYYAAFMILPLALLGLIVMWRTSWRAALFFTLWFAPATAIYGAYYWGRQTPDIGYMRFFLTVLPPLFAMAVWFIREGGWRRRRPEASDADHRGSIAAPIAAGAIVAFACWMGLQVSLASLAREQAINLNLWFTSQSILRQVPPRSVLLVEEAGWMSGVLNFMQWRGEYDLYSTDAFKGGLRWLQGGGRPGGNRPARRDDGASPSPLQPERIIYLRDHVYPKYNPDQLLEKQRQIMLDAINSNRRVFVLQPVDWASALRISVRPGQGLTGKLVDKWKEPQKPYNVVPGPLMPPASPFSMGSDPKTWQLVEIVKGESPQATTQPTLLQKFAAAGAAKKPATSQPATRPTETNVISPSPSPTTQSIPTVPSTIPASLPTTNGAG